MQSTVRASKRVYGIVQGGVYEDLRVESAEFVARQLAATGSRSAGRWGRTRRRCTRSSSWTTRELERLAPDRPRHLLGIGDVDDLIAGVELGIDTFDCAMPTRLARHGVALVPDPDGRWRVDLMKSRWRESRRADAGRAARVPRARRGYTRGYLHYLLRARELTALRLITLHNLGFIARLMEDLRRAVEEDRLPEVGGSAPGWDGARLRYFVFPLIRFLTLGSPSCAS